MAARRVPGVEARGSRDGHVCVAPAQDAAHSLSGTIEPGVQRLPRPRKAESEDGAERQEHAGHREHVGVHRVRDRLDDARGSPDPEVLERVAEEEADKRKQDTAGRGNPRLPMQVHAGSIRSARARVTQPVQPSHNWRRARRQHVASKCGCSRQEPIAESEVCG